MIEQFVDIDTGEGTMRTFVVAPERGGPYPVVAFLMDAPGMREEIRDMSRRLASSGYAVVSPHLYYRMVDHYNVFETGDRDRMFELMSSLSNEMVDRDITAAVAALDGVEGVDVDTSRLGVVGYCMSGPFAVHFAGSDDRVAAAASIHGVALVTDAEDSPHRQLATASAEIYVGCAETDHYAPPEMVNAFDDALAASGCDGEVEWYPGTEHGFAYAERPQYDRDASERHWERLHSLFRRRLHATS